MRRCTTHALYWSKLWQQDHCQHPCWITTNNRDVPRVMKTKFPATVMVFGVVSSEGYSIPPDIFEVGLKVNTKVYLDVLKSVVIGWWLVADPGCGSRTRRQPTSPKRPRLGFRRSATTLYPSLTGSPPPSTWTHWTTLFGHMLRTSPTWPPTTPKPAWLLPFTEYSLSSHRHLWKSMLPVPDLYRGGDWGWRRLYWIAVRLFSLGRQFYHFTL